MCTNFKFTSRLIFKSVHFSNVPHRTAALLYVRQNDLLNITIKRHAGHAKWQNVKHVKAEKDRQKTLVCNKYAFLIRMAVREGGPDPKLNSKLGDLLDQAKKNNIPSSTIASALKRGDNKKTKFGTMEIIGPGGIVVVLEYETDNVSTTRHEIKSTCKKHGANVLIGEGRWRAVYEQKGIIKAIAQKDGEPLNEEKALDAAIEAGAEEVKTKNDEDKPYFEFLCAPNDLNPVKKEIEQLYKVEEGCVGYLPIVTVELDEETNILVDNFLEDLSSLSDVVRIYENVK
ncbi:translational activator of cytochrome c oxidase 1 [Caerostris darwini]|uniref:Translational activator of cytochrome c oxidase 1 n=1 Tax=Caerostris darwini TaxID=1538125 RepID=A0AAV4PYH4_9ARAC|nr:translational activator of cytochrome c oxidase 1 [Caerostris darwini]